MGSAFSQTEYPFENEGESESDRIDFDKRIYIVVDLYVSSKLENGFGSGSSAGSTTLAKKINLDEIKTNAVLKMHIKDIILSAFAKAKCQVRVSENNILLILKSKNNDDYLEMNTTVDVVPGPLSAGAYPDLTTQKIKLYILNELYAYTSNEYGVVISPNVTLVFVNNTLHSIDVYQK